MGCNPYLKLLFSNARPFSFGQFVLKEYGVCGETVIFKFIINYNTFLKGCK